MQFLFQNVTQCGEVVAYATMIMIPILVLFLMFQRTFVQSIVTSGLKG